MSKGVLNIRQVMYKFFKIVKSTKIGLGSSDADQIAGLDIPEMGVYGYVD
jgi:hypothetical protein